MNKKSVRSPSRIHSRKPAPEQTSTSFNFSKDDLSLLIKLIYLRYKTNYLIVSIKSRHLVCRAEMNNTILWRICNTWRLSAGSESTLLFWYPSLKGSLFQKVRGGPFCLPVLTHRNSKETRVTWLLFCYLTSTNTGAFLF